MLQAVYKHQHGEALLTLANEIMATVGYLAFDGQYCVIYIYICMLCYTCRCSWSWKSRHLILGHYVLYFTGRNSTLYLLYLAVYARRLHGL